jgi:hypothetical protein
MDEYHFKCIALSEVNDMYKEKYEKNDTNLFDLLCFVIKRSIKYISSRGNEYKLTQLSLLDASLINNKSVRIFISKFISKFIT